MFCILSMCGHKCLLRISDRYLHYLRKCLSFEKLPIILYFIMECVVAMETYVTLF